MAFVAVNLSSSRDKEAPALAVAELFDAKSGNLHTLLIYEPTGTGEFLESLQVLSAPVFDYYYVDFSPSMFDIEMISLVLGRHKSGARYMYEDARNQPREVERNLQLSSLEGLLCGKLGLAEQTESFDTLLSSLLGYLSSLQESPVLYRARELLIALENIYKFEALRSYRGGCLGLEKGFSVSQSIQAAISFAMQLETSRSLAFPEISLCAEHLRDGKTIFRMLRLPPVDSEEFIVFRKLNVWCASLHLSQAFSICRMEGHSNAAMHHCVRAVECYLLGVLVAGKKILIDKNNVARDLNRNRLKGVSELLNSSPEPVPSAITNIVSLRNKSELAHGQKRWAVSAAKEAVGEVRSFLASMDKKYSEGEFIQHYRKASSVELQVSINKLVAWFDERIEEEFFIV